MKKISVIIPCHNSANYVDRCFESIKDQTMDMEEIECIFVDDASDDGGATWSKLEKIEAQAPDSVALIGLDENMRQGGARNVGMEYMSGEYMLFLDADDLYRPEAFQELYDCAKRNNADIVQFNHDVIWSNDNSFTIPQISTEREEMLCELNDKEIRKLFLTGAAGSYGCTNKLYSVKLLKTVNVKFAEHIVYEEPLFVYPLMLYANRFVFLDAAYYIWLKHSGSTMTSELGRRLMDHPQVQLDLLHEIRNRDTIYYDYKDEVEFNFFYSFIYETLLFSAINNGVITIDACEQLKKILFEECPQIQDNKYVIEKKDYGNILRMVNECDCSVEAWRGIIEETVRVFKNNSN